MKAYVGGVDYSYFQYDMCTQGRRQVGSTIKPYLYALAMENGWSPCDEAPNVQTTYHVAGREWTPRNGSKARYGEMVTLKWGLAQSNNWISAWLMNQLSPAALVRLIHEFGVENRDIHPSLFAWVRVTFLWPRWWELIPLLPARECVVARFM